MRHALFLHLGDTSCQTKLGPKEHCFSACCLSSTQDLKTGDLAMLADAKDGMKGMHMKLHQMLNVLVIQCPGLAPKENRCENNSTVDLELSEELDVVSDEHFRAKPSKCLACFADP